MQFLLALGIALVLTPAVGRLAPRMGLVDRPKGPLKIHREPVPLAGVVVLLAAVGAAVALDGRLSAWVLAALGLATLAGLADDVRPLPAWVRLLLQAGAGGLLVVGGFRLEPLGPLGAAGIVLLVVACVNAVNLIDGQDGLAAGLGLAAALGLAGLATGGRAVGLGLALGGSLLGFLAWNRPPARVFLGNGGAYGVGVLLAVLVPFAVQGRGWAGLAAAGLCLGVFAFELVLTVARRVWAREPLAGGDRRHSYDLLAAGLGRTPTTVVFWTAGAALAGLAQLVGAVRAPVGIPVAVAVGLVGTALGLLLWLRHAPAGPTGARTGPNGARTGG